jgi:hypothetical protein
MTEPNDTVKLDPEVYREAAKALAAHGMCKGVIRTRDGRLCMIGALSRAVTGAGSIFLAYRDDLARRAQAAGLRQAQTESPSPAVRFNDHPDTTQAEVEKFLLQAADDLEVGR